MFCTKPQSMSLSLASSPMHTATCKFPITLSILTVIITTLNEAWASQNSMIDLFLESFRQGEGTSFLLKHLIIVALDQAAYDRCITLHQHCFTLRTEGVDFSGEKYFMTEDYLKMMWRRIDFLRIVLELNYSFVFSDADIMWFRNPFPHFSKEADFEIACDKYYGNPTDLSNQPNGGYVHVQASSRTVDFYKFWYQSRQEYPGKHDQDVLNRIKFTSSFMEIGLKLRFLNTEYFGGFCQVSKDLEKVCTMHANCCTGLERKLQDLRLVLDDWKRFKSMTPLEKFLGRVYWSAPRKCVHSLRE
ncbi:hypothetical protein O6H91_17G088400 [Diphasiastrum complanatum]|uniref:Uncharacterized protein n=1 Tax=Diphasiastrum complanatum TaxID=34168 RepID=A0ACC2B8X0_DIPCM|nr:hypothetical protein O6H91_17G088400 [Diphasiastrum complanatum]